MSVAETAASLREVAEHSGAWPFEEARKIVARLKKKPKDEVIFETGYGPSGLPHIGSFGEVARTTMVRHAFRVLTDDKIKTRKAWRTMVVRATSPKVPMCGSPEGP